MPILTASEARKYSNLPRRAWKAFCERTGLEKIPGTYKYNSLSIDLALELDARNHVKTKEIQSEIHGRERENMVGEQLHITGGRQRPCSFIVPEDPDRKPKGRANCA